MEYICLEDIFDITGGQITSRIEVKDDSAGYNVAQVLIPKAIANGFVSTADLGTLKIHDTLSNVVDSRRITAENDIVIKLSSPYDACLITKQDEGLLVPSFCACLRTKNNAKIACDLNYALAFLNSKYCQAQIKHSVAGSTIAIISVTLLRKLKMPLPIAGQQKAIADNYINSMKKLVIFQKMLSLEKEKNDSYFFEMTERQ